MSCRAILLSAIVGLEVDAENLVFLPPPAESEDGAQTVRQGRQAGDSCYLGWQHEDA